jgi:hypothetical protein
MPAPIAAAVAAVAARANAAAAAQAEEAAAAAAETSTAVERATPERARARVVRSAAGSPAPSLLSMSTAAGAGAGDPSVAAYGKREFEQRFSVEKGYRVLWTTTGLSLPANATDVGTTVPRLTCVSVGSRAAGKTALFMRMATGTFSSEYIPTSSDVYVQCTGAGNVCSWTRVLIGARVCARVCMLVCLLLPSASIGSAIL